MLESEESGTKKIEPMTALIIRWYDVRFAALTDEQCPAAESLKVCLCAAVCMSSVFYLSFQSLLPCNNIVFLFIYSIPTAPRHTSFCAQTLTLTLTLDDSRPSAPLLAQHTGARHQEQTSSHRSPRQLPPSSGEILRRHS